ncbi:hypothetical protein [Psychrobacillus sp. NPDC093180]|uniref:hypothetical protein n=1 Tax=Psychrobacillus sp. NPDC093180 TaxID=3364489 RepID=UPI003814A4DE
MDERKIMAEKIIEFFNTCPKVKVATIRGSIFHEKTDEFSDIDLTIDVSSTDNAAFALQIPKMLESNFEIWFVDWATSLLPDEYVISIYLKNMSIFWNVDIACTATPHIETILSIQNDPIHHALKLWIMNLKYLNRQDLSKQTIDSLVQKVIGDQMKGNSYQKMAAILKEIQKKSPVNLLPFLKECEIELEKYRQICVKGWITDDFNI